MRSAFHHTKHHGGNILRGVRDMLLLRSVWVEHIGNTRLAFMLALVVNMMAMPLGAWFALNAAEGTPLLGLKEQLVIEFMMLALTLLVIFLMAFARMRMQKFAVVYAGVTYSGLVIAFVLVCVEGVLMLYGQSLYGQTAPMMAHSLLFGALIWMIILTSFVFKTGLKVGVPGSITMTAILFFVIIAGRNILEILWINYL